jgi:hypothetical protein
MPSVAILACGSCRARVPGSRFAPHPSPTRAEFDKGPGQFTVNLLGQLRAIDNAGRFRVLTVREILDEGVEEEARELTRHVFDVGRAVHAYAPDDALETVFAITLKSCREHLEHVPSSLQWIEKELRRGTFQPRLTATESWLLDPLIRYAHAAGLEDAAHYFEGLMRRVEQRLSLAAGGRSATR